LAELKKQATIVAVASMEKILGNERNVSRNLTLMIKRQVEEMRGALLVAVRVSPVDFPDTEALRMALGNSDGACKLIVDPSLESGDCRIQLSLGEVNIGVAQQLSALKALVSRSHGT
jgi:flagellar assembly protein FliH